MNISQPVGMESKNSV